MIKAIIFDFDGVLVESVDIKTKAFAKLFEPEGAALVKKIVKYHTENAGVSRFEKFKYIYKHILGRALAETDFKDLCDRFSYLVMEEVIKAPYVKGAKEFLEKYSSAYKCFVSSATPQAEIEKIAEARKMRHYFTEVRGAPETKGVIVKNIIDGHVISPDQAVYVGDALSDLDAAHDNGIFFIARITSGGCQFKNIDCIKVKDLLGLSDIITNIPAVSYGR